MLEGRRIVLVEDDEIMGASIDQRLRLEGADVHWLKLMRQAVGALRTPRRRVDAVICDIRLPDGTGEALFGTLCRTVTPPPFLFITGQGDTGQAVRLLRAGAAHYLTKPFDMADLLGQLVQMTAGRPHPEGQGVLGISPAARRIEDLAASAADLGSPLLIRGAPGTGKARLARAVHAQSDRRAAPLVVVAPGRSDAAGADLRAAARAVEDGILLIDGIEWLEAPDQGWLMHWLDGAPAARLVATGAGDLPARVGAGAASRAGAGAGQLRGDLLARISATDLVVPPLRERPEDAVWLLHRMFRHLTGRGAGPVRAISDLTEQAVRGHDWPGNGREMRARLIRALHAASGDTLFPADLFPERALPDGETLPTLAEIRDAAERGHILRALELSGGHPGEAARLLGVSRTTLWEKMQKLHLTS